MGLNLHDLPPEVQARIAEQLGLEEQPPARKNARPRYGVPAAVTVSPPARGIGPAHHHQAQPTIEIETSEESQGPERKLSMEFLAIIALIIIYALLT